MITQSEVKSGVNVLFLGLTEAEQNRIVFNREILSHYNRDDDFSVIACPVERVNESAILCGEMLRKGLSAVVVVIPPAVIEVLQKKKRGWAGTDFEYAGYERLAIVSYSNEKEARDRICRLDLTWSGKKN